jgi:hypothetical protein
VTSVEAPSAAPVVTRDDEAGESGFRHTTIDALDVACAPLRASGPAEIPECNAFDARSASRGAIWHRSITSREELIDCRDALVVHCASIVENRDTIVAAVHAPRLNCVAISTTWASIYETRGTQVPARGALPVRRGSIVTRREEEGGSSGSISESRDRLDESRRGIVEPYPSIVDGCASIVVSRGPIVTSSASVVTSRGSSTSSERAPSHASPPGRSLKYFPHLSRQ